MNDDMYLPHLTLYVAGDLPNSRRARAHIEDWLLRGSIPRENIEVVDVLAHPERAAEDNIFITPALVFSGADGPQTFVGDLSDSEYPGSLQSLAKGPDDTAR
ncbi:MAG: circadian clock KaiB family protein [Chromatocurvus sp.]